MGKYTNDAKELLHLVGGRENIAAVSHCITRMRFVLNDPKKADIQKIEAMKAVKGSFTQAGQFQVIIGNTVSDFYNDFIAVAGIEGVSKRCCKERSKTESERSSENYDCISRNFRSTHSCNHCGRFDFGIQKLH